MIIRASCLRCSRTFGPAPLDDLDHLLRAVHYHRNLWKHPVLISVKPLTTTKEKK